MSSQFHSTNVTAHPLVAGIEFSAETIKTVKTQLCFPGGSVVKNLLASAGDARMQVRSLGGEDPLEEEWQPTPVFLPGKFHRQRTLVGYSPWGRKESDTTERLCTHKTQFQSS